MVRMSFHTSKSREIATDIPVLKSHNTLDYCNYNITKMRVFLLLKFCESLISIIQFLFLNIVSIDVASIQKQIS